MLPMRPSISFTSTWDKWPYCCSRVDDAKKNIIKNIHYDSFFFILLQMDIENNINHLSRTFKIKNGEWTFKKMLDKKFFIINLLFEILLGIHSHLKI